MKNKTMSFLFTLLLFQMFNTFTVHAGSVSNKETADRINALMKGPLSQIMGIAIAMLILTVIAAFISQLVRLVFKPNVAIVKADIMNNFMSLGGILIMLGIFLSIGFSSIMGLMNKNSAVSGEVLKETDINVSRWMLLIEDYKGLIMVLYAIASITMVAAFIINIMKLAAAAGNPQKRREAINGILITGMATSILGGITLIITILINFGVVT